MFFQSHGDTLLFHECINLCILSNHIDTLYLASLVVLMSKITTCGTREAGKRPQQNHSWRSFFLFTSSIDFSVIYSIKIDRSHGMIISRKILYMQALYDLLLLPLFKLYFAICFFGVDLCISENHCLNVVKKVPVLKVNTVIRNGWEPSGFGVRFAIEWLEFDPNVQHS